MFTLIGMQWTFASVLFVLAHGLVAAAADNGMAARWTQYREAMRKDPALLRFYTFENLASPTDPVYNVAPKDPNASLTFKLQPKPGVSNQSLSLIEGRWPGKKGVRLDQGYLAAPMFALATRAFTATLWFRKNGPGVHRGNNETPNGTLISLGNGYYDGWRVTTTYPERTLSFEIGRSKPAKSSIGIRSVDAAGDGAWHHLAAVWNGAEMRLYLDGMMSAIGMYNGNYTSPGKDGNFRLGYANAGVGSVVLDVDEAAVFSRAFSEEEILRAAYLHLDVPPAFISALRQAEGQIQQKQYAAAEAGLAAILKAKGLHPELAAVTQLRLATVLNLQKKHTAAITEFADLVNADKLPARFGSQAMAESMRLLADVPPSAYPRPLLEKIMVQPNLAGKERRSLQLGLARSLREEGNPGEARKHYQNLLADPEMPIPERLTVQLELAHVCFEAKDYGAARKEYERIINAVETPLQMQSLALMRTADSYLRETNWDGAKKILTRMCQMKGDNVLLPVRSHGKRETPYQLSEIQDAAAHHREEAKERLEELERLKLGKPERDPMASRLDFRLPTPNLMLYVATNGSDANPGTLPRPFATLERARDEIRSLKTKGALPSGGVGVYVRGGDYPVKMPFSLVAVDSGTESSPITYQSYPGESARFTGGQKISGAEPVRDAAILNRLPPEARGKVMQLDLKAWGVTNIPKLKRGGYASGSGFKTYPQMEVFFNGRPLELARWPNDAYAKVVDISTTDTHRIHSATGSKKGEFVYEGDRPNRWKEEHDIWVYGYWFWDWADSYEKVISIDPEAKKITLATPYHRYGYRKGQRFYALNLLCEIDRPGEMFLDREQGLLYFYPPSDPAQATMELSRFEKIMVTMDGLKNVHFRGITWELGSGDAFIMKNSTNCALVACTVRRFGGDGVSILGGARCGLLACDIYTMGRGGVEIVGGNRKDLSPGSHYVENCHMYDLSRIDHTYTPAVQVDGVANRVVHNLLHDSPSSAMRVEGNDHRIEFNDVSRVLLESDDQGAVDMWGNPSYRGNVFRYNYWHHIGNGLGVGQAGIRLDDAISGTLIYGNVFYRCSDGNFGGVQIHGGKDNCVDNNIFVECRSAISFTPWRAARWKEFLARPEVAKKLMGDVNISQPPYRTKYPELVTLNEGVDANNIWRNLAVNCEKFLARDSGVNNQTDNLQTRKDPGFEDMANGNFRLKPGSPIYDRFSFRPIPFAEIGLYKSEFRPSLPTTGGNTK
jgi:predicted negative regulator of RcsB-dependent stress response